MRHAVNTHNKQKKKNYSFFSSLQVKIPLFFGLIFLLFFQIIGYFFSQEMEKKLLDNYTTQMVSQSNLISANAKVIFSKNETVDLETQINQLLQSTLSHHIINMQIVNQEKKVIGVSNTKDLIQLGQVQNNVILDTVLNEKTTHISQFLSNQENNTNGIRTLRIVTTIENEQNEITGALIFDANLERIYQQTEDISKIFLNIMIVVVILIVIISIVIANFSIVSPIIRIKKKTEDIASGAYDTLDVKIKSFDEIGVLANIVNDLGVRIKEANIVTAYERQRLDGVLTHMSDGVVATDRRGNVVIINDAALDMLGISHKEDVLNVSIMDLLGIRNKYNYRELLQTTDELILSIDAQSGIAIIKGEFSVIKRTDGYITGLVCVLTDITEQEKIEAERREFVSNVSHELRTPLTSLKSYTETLIDGAWEDKTIAPKFLQVIQSESERMIRMVTDLLDLSKMDSGKQVLQLDVVDMTALLNKVLDRYDMLLNSEEYKEQHYKIIRRIVNHSLFVEIDPDRIIRVLDNLLNNAIKYSPDGSEIIVRLIETEDSVCISVTDFGLGIPKQSLNKIFDRFYRVDKARSRQQGGTGLGLAISKEVINLHGGKIWVNSVEQKGSTFFISLTKINMDDIDKEMILFE